MAEGAPVPEEKLDIMMAILVGFVGRIIKCI
jgi:hypothetical protein